MLASILNVTNEPNSVIAADVNGDGKPDLIWDNLQYNTLSVLTNDGSGGFAPSGTYVVGNGPFQIVAADVNGDGKVDLICANYNDSTLTVLTNNGSGGFALSGTYAVGVGSVFACAADVNGDGKVDLIASSWNNASGNTLTVLTNNGSGGFVLASTPGVDNGVQGVTAADVNGDGKMDLICVNQNENELSVLTNYGSGGFALSGTYPVGSGASFVVAADVNGDGWVDLICENEWDDTLTVLTNDGRGGFVLGGTFAADYHPNGMVAADVNGDGKVDLIVGNQYSSTLTVLTNATPFPANAPPVVTAQPTDQTVAVGGTATFSVSATGSQLSYQWRFGPKAIVGATNAFLTLTNVQSSQAGNYAVLVTNLYGSTPSSNAVLTVTPAQFTWSQIPTPRYANVPFAVSIQARDMTNGLFPYFTGFVSLDSTNGTAVAPVVSGNFVQGVWTGSVVISQAASNLVLRSSDGQGHFGLANPISVINLPKLGMLRSGNIAIFIWPVGYSGFVLETSGRLSPPTWVVVPYSPIQIGDQYLLPLDMTGTNGFYRLWFPGP